MTNPVVAHGGRKLRMQWDHVRDQSIYTTMGGKIPGGKVFKACTVCVIKDEDGTPVFNGKAWCKVNDIFTRDGGRKRSLTNAIKDLPREERGKFWFAYFARLGLSDAALEKMLSWKSRRKRRKVLRDA